MVLAVFLSCLSGSERWRSCRKGTGLFLSCLSGSEHTATCWQRRRSISELPVRQ
ncbi:hypothetical protein LHGZ1_1565 [Laribacter hongkongensis]|uniref:Uncharacterized protein n=1 Tax=Laribacter hongkongensis TaxID=168471 RepID=A0A248LJ56_9NEIS|nr:hypothetical protein LHGZ1_1565 [Laribacter hongkongensis]